MFYAKTITLIFPLFNIFRVDRCFLRVDNTLRHKFYQQTDYDNSRKEGQIIMRIAICDDEDIMHELLKEALENYSAVRNILFLYDDYFRGSDLVSGSNAYDLIFMDYQMKDTDGLETVRELRKNNVKTPVIFLTSYPQVVFDAFEVDTFRFLLKPINEAKLFSALDDFVRSLDDDHSILIKTDEKNERINIDDIIYVEADDKYCCIRTVNANYLYKNTLSMFEEMLPSDRFVRSHRTYLVGFRHIVSHTSKDILFDNNEKALISKTKLAHFKKTFADYLKRYSFGGYTH